ncbi:class I SAM-dependent methyltransferase [Geodermatophilus sp. SYSU D00703]
MSSPDPTSAEAVEQLRAAGEPAATRDAPPPARELARRLAGPARRAARTATRRIADRAYRRVAERVNTRLKDMVREEVAADPTVGQLRELSSHGMLDEHRIRHQDESVRATQVNLELLKGELRHIQGVLDELGMAFAPATGLAGAGARFAELREAVHALERRLRNSSLPSGPPAGSADGGAPPVPAPADGRRPEVLSSTLFDYVGFERRFRGDPEEILATLVDRYGDQLADHQPVVDLGCGRAELLGRLAERGVEVVGIEPDPGMAAEARSRGITVHEALAGDWLRSVPDGSLGSIITTHVLEHLELDDLIELLELSAVKLRPGGVFISETPNPASLIVLGNSYLLDPTHVRPLHPSLLAFLCEKAGFRDVRLQFFSPATGYHLPRIPLESQDDLPPWAAEVRTAVDEGFARLNEVLFGPQDYAVVATTAPAAEG